MMGIRNNRIHPWLTAMALALMAAAPFVNNYINKSVYRAVSMREAECQYLPFFVPPDGSVSLDDCARAEGIRSPRRLEAYMDKASTHMLPGYGMVPDSGGNIIMLLEDRWDPNTGEVYRCPVEIDPNEWSGGLPKGVWVRLPDEDGNGRVGKDNLMEPYGDANRRAQQMMRKMYEDMARKSHMTGDRSDGASGL